MIKKSEYFEEWLSIAVEIYYKVKKIGSGRPALIIMVWRDYLKKFRENTRTIILNHSSGRMLENIFWFRDELKRSHKGAAVKKHNHERETKVLEYLELNFFSDIRTSSWLRLLSVRVWKKESGEYESLKNWEKLFNKFKVHRQLIVFMRHIWRKPFRSTYLQKN